MTPPLPPPGYELVEDEPRENDLAWFGEWWEAVDEDLEVYIFEGSIPARDLRWIARKK